MRRTVAVFVLAILFAAAAGLSAHAEKRVAMVIGNSAYTRAPELRNTKNDAEGVAALLARLGFDVIKAIDFTERDFGRAIGEFSEKLQKPADVAVFYYAGHGLQVDGENYLVPVDARLDREASLDFEAVRLSTIVKLMEQRRRTNIVLLDACRDNPLARNLARNMGTRSTAIGRGFAQVETGVGTLIAYSTQPGNVALDGSGRNSPFTAALLRHSETPGIEIEALMRQVRRDVIEATNGAQVPWSHSSLTAAFRLIDQPTETQSVSAPPEPTAVPLPGVVQRVDPKAVELAFWDSIRDSENAELIAEYLKRYPQGSFSTIARIMLDQVKSSKSEIKTARLMDDAAPDPDPDPLAQASPRQRTLALQSELQRVGCDPGVADGLWGNKGKAALAKFNRYANVGLSLANPTAFAVRTIRS